MVRCGDLCPCAELCMVVCAKKSEDIDRMASVGIERKEVFARGLCMKKMAILFAVMQLMSGCGESSECSDGTRVCEGNTSKTCVYGEWRIVECKDAAPICDEKYGCMKSPNAAECGNNVIESGEECDGAAVFNKTCADINTGLTGTLRCTSDCRFDTQACVVSECIEDERQCSGDVLQYCSGRVWKDVQDCAAEGLVCNSEKKRCAAE